MSQDFVFDLDDIVIQRLNARALRENKSLEELVRDILIEAAKPSKEEGGA